MNEPALALGFLVKALAENTPGADMETKIKKGFSLNRRSQAPKGRRLGGAMRMGKRVFIDDAFRCLKIRCGGASGLSRLECLLNCGAGLTRNA